MPSSIHFFAALLLEHADMIQEERVPARYTVEIGVGLGVLGKGLEISTAQGKSSSHETVWHAISSRLSGVQKDLTLHSSHTDDFFWTSNKHPAAARSAQAIARGGGHAGRVLKATSSDDVMSSPAGVFEATSARFKRALSLACDFSTAQVNHLQSHVSVSMDTSVTHSPDCMLFLASVAALHPQVSHVSAYSSELHLENQDLNSVHADDVFNVNTTEATDQNAWTQTGSSLTTPYSDRGLDGANYVLGMIDTGVDDFSCFFVDDSGTATTRTAAANYATPITEPNRRKVIQYVAWADSLPAYDYDHGEFTFVMFASRRV